MWIPKNIAVFLMVLFCAKMVVGNTLKLPLFHAQVKVIHLCEHQKAIASTAKKASFNDQETPIAAFAINCHQVFLSTTEAESIYVIPQQNSTFFHHHDSSTPVSLEDPLPPPQRGSFFA